MIFVFFHEFAKFFETSKKKYVQVLLALTFHGIVVVKNFHNARRISKFVFSGLNYFDQSMNFEKHEFFDSALIVEAFDFSKNSHKFLKKEKHDQNFLKCLFCTGC